MYLGKLKEVRYVLLCKLKSFQYALTQKRKSLKKEQHWLDHASDKYGSQLVNDIKATLHVLVLYIPLPIFWTLYDQQGSGWTFQARRMDGDIGFYTILPDQMQVVNPLLILAFIPIFTYGIYPLLNKCHLLVTPLQKMSCGAFLTAVAFAVSAIVSMELESTYPVLPTNGNIQLRAYNPSNCNGTLQIDKINVNISLEAKSYYEMKDIKFEGSDTVSFAFLSDCMDNKTKNISLKEATAFGIYVGSKDIYWFVDEIAKSEDGYPKIR